MVFFIKVLLRRSWVNKEGFGWLNGGEGGLMTNNEEISITFRGPMAAVVKETSRGFGVDSDTLVMMAVSQFLNSELASGYVGSGKGNLKFIALPDEIKSENEFDSKVSPYFIDASQGATWNDVFEGLRLEEQEFTNCPTILDSWIDEETILWGQFSRFLPIKVSLRILAAAYRDKNPGEYVTIDDWFSYVFEFGISIRSYLKNLDKEHKNPRGEQLASGFPKWDEGGKSLNRFVNHFCASQYNDETIVGFPSHLGLISVEGTSGADFSEWRVALTQAGLDYISLKNPVIDEKSPTTSMSQDEAEFMMNRIEEGLPSSWGFLKFVLSSIAQGNSTPSTLSTEISRVYGRGTSRNWNEKQVPTYRTGAIGLLGDMGLISRSWKYRSVIYSVTEKGMEVLNQ